MDAPVDAGGPTDAAATARAAQPWHATFTVKGALADPFTGPGPVLWGVVALLAAVPRGSLPGCLTSLWVMVRVIESTMKAGRRMPSLPKGPEARDELTLSGRSLAVKFLLLLPLVAVFAAAVVPRRDPDLPGTEVVPALVLFATLVTVALLPPSLVRLIQGSSLAEALDRILVCPRRRGVMRVVAFVTEPRVLRRILDHLAASALRATQNRAPPPSTLPARVPS